MRARGDQGIGPSGTAAGPLTVAETARLLGHYQWVEMRLFEAVGGWVQAEAEPQTKLLLGRHAPHHGWHAEMWAERRPDLRGDTPPIIPPGDGLLDFFEALAAPRDPGAIVERLVGVYRVLLPRKIAVYSEHLTVADPVADGPVARALRFVLADELEDWREGEALLQTLLGTPEQVERAAGHQARLELLLTAGLFGAARSGGTAGSVGS